MRRYTGLLRYSHDNSGREVPYVKVELAAPFSPGRFAVVVQDATAHTRRVLANRRFNFQARDPPHYSPARGKWRSYWRDRFVGAAYLRRPRIAGAPWGLHVHVIFSWGPRILRDRVPAGRHVLPTDAPPSSRSELVAADAIRRRVESRGWPAERAAERFAESPGRRDPRAAPPPKFTIRR